MKGLLALLLASFAPLSLAADVTGTGANTSFGEAADSVTTLLAHAHGIIEVVFIVAAIAMATSAVLKYRLHRRSPQQVPLSTPVMEAVIAAVLLCIPFLIEYSSSSEHIEKAKPVSEAKHYHMDPNQSRSTTPPPPSSPYPH